MDQNINKHNNTGSGPPTPKQNGNTKDGFNFKAANTANALK